MLILRNLEAGRSYEHGIDPDLAVPAMMNCLLKGWADRNRITPEGRKVLELAIPAKSKVEITIIKEEKVKPPILLPPKGGWGTLPS